MYYESNCTGTSSLAIATLAGESWRKLPHCMYVVKYSAIMRHWETIKMLSNKYNQAFIIL